MKKQSKTEDACTKLKTPYGVVEARTYDDGIAKGIQVSIGGVVVAMVDCYTDGSEARVLTYKLDCEEPYSCVTVTAN